jgi:hypothetical protein
MIPSTYFKENESSYITNSVNNDESVNNFENGSGGHIGPLITSFKPDNYAQGPSTFSGPLPNSVYNSESAKKSQILDYFIEPNPINSQNVTTSNLIQVRNSLNTLRKESRYTSKSSKNDEDQCEDRFYFDDDDTKVIIVKSLD